MADNHTSHNALEYDTEILKTIPYYNCFHLETIELVKSISPHPCKWLDTGCGTGSFVEKALIEFHKCKFFLSDPSGKMLLICKKRFQTKQVQIIGKHITSEIHEPIKLDIISAIQSHHYMNPTERSEATKNCYDLLRENGLYITFENVKFDSTTETENRLKRWANYQREQGRNLKEIELHLSRFNKNYFPIKISEHLELMKKIGFRNVELFWLSNMQAGFYGIK